MKWLVLMVGVVLAALCAPPAPAVARVSVRTRSAEIADAATLHRGPLPPAVVAPLNRLLRGLPADEVRLIEQALAKRPLARVTRAVAELRKLPAAKRRAMVIALRNGLGPLTVAQRRAVIDGLLGAARGRELAAVDRLAGGAVQQIFALAHQDMDALPAQFGDGGDPNALQFIDQVFALMQGNLQALLAHALDRAPVGARALLAENDLAGLRQLAAELGGPGAVGVILLFLQSAQAEQFVQQAAYQAGYDCGLGACDPSQYFVIAVSGVHVMPGLIQQDLVDCAEGPVCTRVELNGIVAWVRDNIAEAQAQQALVNAITADFQADTTNIARGWIDIYGCVAAATC